MSRYIAGKWQKPQKGGMRMSEPQVLLGKVEELRQQLHALIMGKALTDPEVLALSHRLDQALNEYQEHRKVIRQNRQRERALAK